MRGSVHYQSAQLVKAIFQEGAKKEQRVDPTHPYYKKIASYKTMESYRNVWNNMFHYLREHWNLKDPEKIEPIHVAAYIDYKIEYYPSRLYLNKIVSAIGKLQDALEMYTAANGRPKKYDFGIRETIKRNAVDLDLVANNYHDRAYDDPETLVRNLTDSMHRLAATIQLEGGARLEGVGLIEADQLKGARIDEITGEEKGILWTREKGGKEGEVLVSLPTYEALKRIVDKKGKFRIDRKRYADDIREACRKLSVPADGSHGLRWNFAQRRLYEYGKAGYPHERALAEVSREMKHNRASITMHYMGG